MDQLDQPGLRTVQPADLAGAALPHGPGVNELAQLVGDLLAATNLVSPDKLDSLLMMIDEMGIRLIDDMDVAEFTAKSGKKGASATIAVVAPLATTAVALPVVL